MLVWSVHHQLPHEADVGSGHLQHRIQSQASWRVVNQTLLTFWGYDRILATSWGTTTCMRGNNNNTVNRTQKICLPRPSSLSPKILFHELSFPQNTHSKLIELCPIQWLQTGYSFLYHSKLSKSFLPLNYYLPHTIPLSITFLTRYSHGQSARWGLGILLFCWSSPPACRKGFHETARLAL